MEKNKSLIALSLIATAGFIVGHLVFPFVLFLTIAPLIAISKIEHKFKNNHFDFLILGLLMLTQIIIGIMKPCQPLTGLAHAAILWLTFVLFSFTDRHAQNKLGVFTLIIYWLGGEYLSLLLLPDSAYLLLGSGFDGYSIIDWNGYTGLTGVSTWVLFGNIFLYYALFYGEDNVLTGKVRILSISYSLIAIALPIITMSFISYEPSIITSETVKSFFNKQEVSIMPYGIDGEIFARSIGWVSVLIAIYATVKRKVK